jgi:GcrA cell cycle regulator
VKPAGYAWSSEDDAVVIKELNSGNHSYSTIARRLGVSRNAIAGRVHRLRRAGHRIEIPNTGQEMAFLNKQRAEEQRQIRAAARVKKAPKPAAAKAAKPAVEKPDNVVRLRDQVTGKLTPHRVGVLPMTDNPKTILELQPGECKAAVGEPPKAYDGINNPFLFCGARTQEGAVYCADHAKVLFEKKRKSSGGGDRFLLPRVGLSKDY